MGYREHTGEAREHCHARRAGAAVLWVGGASILYLMLGLPLAFASLYLTEYLAIIFALPALPAVTLMRAGLHPIASVAVTLVGYWAAGFGVIEWRAHHRQTARGAVLISR